MNINNAIKEYKEAFEENISASRAEHDAKQWKKKAYYALLKAKDNLHEVERQALQDSEVNISLL